MLLLFSGVMMAQKDPTTLPPKKKVMMADALMSAGSYYNAIDLYSLAYADSKDYATAYKLARAYYLARDYKNAEKWFDIVWKNDKDDFPEADFYLGMSMKYNGKYEDAKTEFAAASHNSKLRGQEGTMMKRQAKNEIKGCDLALLLMQSPVDVTINHLGSNVNNNYTDFSPKFDPNNNLVYASLVSTDIIDMGGNHKTDLRSRIFESDKQGDSWGKATQLSGPFNSADAHVGNGAFSPDGGRFYYTECNPNDSLVMICRIKVSTLVNGKWASSDDVKEVNMSDATSTTPCVGMYKGKEVLYFASDRPGGRGGLDIWYSVISGKGDSYSVPQNCGSKINTKGDEITPFYNVKTDEFYFSSNGQVNIGGFDIFKSTGGEKSWASPTNLGVPFNSSVDDYDFSTDVTGRKGFFVSNRPGGFSVKSETCCDDIYEFKYPPIFTIMAKVFSSADSSVLNDASVDLDRSGSKIDSAVTANDKYSEFFVGTAFDKFDLKSYMDGYYDGKATTSTIGKKESDTLYVDIYMDPIPIMQHVEVKNIYYSLGKWDLRPESFRSLDSIYQVLVDNPQIRVEIGSHTDYRNTDEANQTLSQHRADTVVSYLIAKGIDPARLVAKGYGESTPRVLSEDITLPSGKVVPKGTELSQPWIDSHFKKNSDDYEAVMQLNRRTEFTILGTIANTIISYNSADIEANKAREREEETKKEKQLEDLQQLDESDDTNNQDQGQNTNTNTNTNNNNKTTTDTKSEKEKKTKTTNGANPSVDPTLTKKGTMFEGTAMINGKETTPYILNLSPSLTLAMVSKDYFIKLWNAGVITDADIKNDHPTDLGNGKTVKGDVFSIKTLQLGDAVFNDVIVKINTSSTQNLVVGVKVIEKDGCSFDAKNTRIKCK